MSSSSAAGFFFPFDSRVNAELFTECSRGVGDGGVDSGGEWDEGDESLAGSFFIAPLALLLPSSSSPPAVSSARAASEDGAEIAEAAAFE